MSLITSCQCRCCTPAGAAIHRATAQSPVIMALTPHPFWNGTMKNSKTKTQPLCMPWSIGLPSAAEGWWWRILTRAQRTVANLQAVRNFYPSLAPSCALVALSLQRRTRPTVTAPRQRVHPPETCLSSTTRPQHCLRERERERERENASDLAGNIDRSRDCLADAIYLNPTGLRLLTQVFCLLIIKTCV